MALDHSCIPAVVLIVEDEMMLRMRAVDMVEDAGYTPLEALDAAEAVAILESRSDVALICTDIQMPGQMDGLGLAHAERAVNGAFIRAHAVEPLVRSREADIGRVTARARQIGRASCRERV